MTQLALMSWPEVEAYLKTRDDILIPVGSMEQHGPNGLIGTDILIAQAIASEFGQRSGVCVGPPIAVGMAQHHLAFAGSITLRPTTLIAVVEDMMLSLARSGFRRFHFVNGHGGNNASLEAAFAQVYARATLESAGRGVKCSLFNYFDLPEVRDLSNALYGIAGGMHATAAEIAMTMHLHPGCLKAVEFHPPIAPSRRLFQDADSYRAAYPDGRIGSNPALSCPDHGARFMALSIDGLANAHAAFCEAMEEYA